MNKPFVVGVTGQTGAGKSLAVRLMAKPDWLILDADAIARKVVQPNTPCLEELVKQFSSAILCDDGSLNRQRLADIAFATPQSTAALNLIVHPAVIKVITDALEQTKAPIVLIDAPLLFQAGLDTLCDVTLAVTAPETKRLCRICERDGISKEQALARVNAQPAEEYYRERATMVLENDKDESVLSQKIKTLCEEWQHEQNQT